MADPARDPVADLRDRVDAAHAAAERLVQEAQRRAEEAVRSAEVPPRGWDAPRAEEEVRKPFAPELQAVLGLVETLRAAIPPELAQQLAEAMRELLLALRALIDWYLERLERPPPQPVEVEDIPID